MFCTLWCTSAVTLSYGISSPSWCLIMHLKTWRVLGAELVLVVDSQDIHSETGPAVSLGYELWEDGLFSPWANQIVFFSCYSVLQLHIQSLFHLSPVTQKECHIAPKHCQYCLYSYLNSLVHCNQHWSAGLSIHSAVEGNKHGIESYCISCKKCSTHFILQRKYLMAFKDI